MDYGLVLRLIFYRELGLPILLGEIAEEFHREFSDWNHSNSTCVHLGEGWFALYDFPLAEREARERGQLHKIPHVGDHYLAHFSDLQVAMEYKLRWNNAPKDHLLQRANARRPAGDHPADDC